MNADLIAALKMPAAKMRIVAALNAACHEGDGEPVVALGSNGLDRRGADARLHRQHVIEAAYPHDVGIVAGAIDHPSVAHYIIDDDHAAPPRQCEREFEILRDVLLVGINEGE